jgi:hypothetical protein
MAMSRRSRLGCLLALLLVPVGLSLPRLPAQGPQAKRYAVLAGGTITQ